MRIDVTTDRRLVRSDASSDRYLRVVLQAPEGSGAERPAVNVAIVLDRSGSMGGSKIALAKRAVRHALQLLGSRDRFSLVVYDDAVDVVVESTPASAEAVRNAIERLDRIEARGTTNLCEGWLRGAQQVADRASGTTIDRCLLLTDGLANVGITDPEELVRHAGELERRGVSTTTFGLGADFDEDLLRRMALRGGGNFYFVESAEQIPDYLTSELGETLEVVARDVEIVLTAPDGVRVESLTPARKEARADGEWRFSLGDLVARQELEHLVRLDVAAPGAGRSVIAVDLAVTVGGDTRACERLEWTFADRGRNREQPRDRAVDRSVATAYASRARRDALLLNRAGRYADAVELVRVTVARIRGYAGDDPALHRIADDLEAEVEDFTAAMDVMERKARYARAHYVMHDRDPIGRARRGGS